MIMIKDARIKIDEKLARVFIKVGERTMAFDIESKTDIEEKFTREYYQVATGRRKTAIVKTAKE